MTNQMNKRRDDFYFIFLLFKTFVYDKLMKYSIEEMITLDHPRFQVPCHDST